jgi:hypothetical protein
LYKFDLTALRHGIKLKFRLDGKYRRVKYTRKEIKNSRIARGEIRIQLGRTEKLQDELHDVTEQVG